MTHLVRHTIFTAFLGLMLTLPLQARSEMAVDRYEPVNLKDLTEFSSYFPIANVNQDEPFLDYVRVMDCEQYEIIKNDAFKKQNAKQALLDHRKASKSQAQELFFYIPVTFLTTGYNFETQSLTIAPDKQMNRVSSFTLNPEAEPICGAPSYDIRNIPVVYYLKLNFPISLRRIPLQRTLAEALVNKLAVNANDKSTRIIYGNIYLQIDAIGPESMNPPDKSRVFLRGQVNAINLYVDRERKILFKQLNYSEAF